MKISDLVDKENELREGGGSTSQRRNGLPTRDGKQIVGDKNAISKEKRGLSDPMAKKMNHKTRPWTPDEDKRLAELIESMGESLSGTKTWSRIALKMNRRTGKQCRERWLNQLKPGIRRESWTEEEERILHEAHRIYGNKWVQIAELLPGRTDNSVKNRWNSMIRKRQRRQAAGSSSDISHVAGMSEEPMGSAQKQSKKNPAPESSSSVKETKKGRKNEGRGGGNPLVTLAAAAALDDGEEEEAPLS